MGVRAIGIIGFVLTASVLGAPAPAAAGDPVPPSALLAGVNEYRAGFGIPPVVLDDTMSAGCLAHVDYLHANGRLENVAEPHDQDPLRPGYSALGRLAAQRSNLGYSLLNDGRPFHRAPGHLWGFLHPVAVKAGLAERSVDGIPQSCQWYAFTDADDVQHRRAPRVVPADWVVPNDGATGVPFFEAGAEAAFEVGLVGNPHGPYVAGTHVMLWHDDVDGRDMSNACRAVLLGPGGRAVEARVAPRYIVPVSPLLPGAPYRAVRTLSTAGTCSDLQRTSESRFTTAERRPAQDLITLGDPVLENGEWVARSFVDDVLRNGTGSIRADFGPTFGYDLPGFWHHTLRSTLSADLSEGGSMTLTFENDPLTLGATCWSRTRVGRTYTKNGGVVSAGPVSVQHPQGDPCGTKPAPTPPTPTAGAPGTVVRIAGSAVLTATAVRFGGVDATAWDVDGDALLVTVPTGAQSGPVLVRTPAGEASAGTFSVAVLDGVAPDTRIDLGPVGNSASTTAHVAFSATEAGSTFTCRLNEGPVEPCASPWTREGLAPGAHSLEVRAVDAAGNADATPAVATWTVVSSTPPPPAIVLGPQTPTAGAAPGVEPPAVEPPASPLAPRSAAPRTALTVGSVTVETRGGSVRRRTGLVTLGSVRAARRARITVRMRVGTVRLRTIATTLAAGRRTVVRATIPAKYRTRLLRGKTRISVRAEVTSRTLPRGRAVTRTRTFVLTVR